MWGCGWPPAATLQQEVSLMQRRRYLLCSLHCSLSVCCAVRGGAARPPRRHRRQVPSFSVGPSLPLRLPLRIPVSLSGAVTDHELFSRCFGGRFNLLQVHAQERSFSIPGGASCLPHPLASAQFTRSQERLPAARRWPAASPAQRTVDCTTPIQRCQTFRFTL